MWAVMTANRKSGLYSCETVVVINRKRGREDLKIRSAFLACLSGTRRKEDFQRFYSGDQGKNIAHAK